MRNKYGVIKNSHFKFPTRDLLVVPYRKRKSLTVDFSSFGPNVYFNNIEKIQQKYSHPLTGEQINFRSATTSESISAVAYDFENLAKIKIFNPSLLQAGYLVKTKDGVFINTTITRDNELLNLLDNTKKVNGIYLGKNDFAFVPYNTFPQGVQESKDFAEGGLARGLEHVSGKIAPKLKKISSLENYPLGVNVWGFNPTKKPILRIATLGSYWNFGSIWLDVGGYYWKDGSEGYTVGVLESKKNK